jgi:hypothetical protein
MMRQESTDHNDCNDFSWSAVGEEVGATKLTITQITRRVFVRIAISGMLSLFAGLVFGVPQPVFSEEKPSVKPFVVRSLQEVSIDIAPPRNVGPDGQELPLPISPASRFYEQEMLGSSRDFQPTEVKPLGDWNVRYQPLLFEERNAERYGEVCSPLQPGISAARFYARTLLIPYHLVRPGTRKAQSIAHPDRPGYGGISESPRH